ncbi:hypothetical protein RCL1_005335 [Eukaryota sp. TZLM3-RCL]
MNTTISQFRELLSIANSKVSSLEHQRDQLLEQVHSLSVQVSSLSRQLKDTHSFATSSIQNSNSTSQELSTIRDQNFKLKEVISSMTVELESSAKSFFQEKQRIKSHYNHKLTKIEKEVTLTVSLLQKKIDNLTLENSTLKEMIQSIHKIKTDQDNQSQSFLIDDSNIDIQSVKNDSNEELFDVIQFYEPRSVMISREVQTGSDRIEKVKDKVKFQRIRPPYMMAKPPEG